MGFVFHFRVRSKAGAFIFIRAMVLNVPLHSCYLSSSLLTSFHHFVFLPANSWLIFYMENSRKIRPPHTLPSSRLLSVLPSTQSPDASSSFFSSLFLFIVRERYRAREEGPRKKETESQAHFALSAHSRCGARTHKPANCEIMTS